MGFSQSPSWTCPRKLLLQPTNVFSPVSLLPTILPPPLLSVTDFLFVNSAYFFLLSLSRLGSCTDNLTWVSLGLRRGLLVCESFYCNLQNCSQSYLSCRRFSLLPFCCRFPLISLCRFYLYLPWLSLPNNWTPLVLEVSMPNIRPASTLLCVCGVSRPLTHMNPINFIPFQITVDTRGRT